MILEVISLLLVLGAAIIFHEIGHIYYLNKVLNQKVKVWFAKGHIFAGHQENYVGHSKNQYIGIYGYGIIFGYIPFIFAMAFNSLSPFYMIGGLVIYLSGCVNDFKNLWRYGYKGKKWEIGV